MIQFSKIATATMLGIATLASSVSSYAKDFVVSTQPLYLIAKEVTAGIEQPTLLLNSHDTGHEAHLTPKARQAIQDAQQIVWFGKQYEVALENSLAKEKKAIAIFDYPLMHRLPQRDLKGQAMAGSLDPHVWLDPNNAVRIAFFVASLRGQLNPQHKAKYMQNAQNFAKRMLDASKINLNKKEQPYWAYHDAYQYLERSLKLKYVGGLTVDHHLAPTPAQLVYLNQNRPQPQMCLLAEYHADKSLQQKLQPVKMSRVDEAMSKEKDFIQGWLNVANTVNQCTG